MKRAIASLALLLTAAVAGADDLERTVSMMAKIGFCNAPFFSPDGKRIAFNSNMNGIPQVWIVGADGGWPEQITALDDPVGPPEWSPDGQWIAVQVAPGGGLNSQVYVVRPDGTGLRRLTEGGKENNWLAHWTPDSKSLAISSNRRSGDAMDAWLVDVANCAAPPCKMSMLAQNPGIGTVSSISSNYALVDRMRSRGDNDLYRVSLTGGAEVALTRHAPPAQFDGDLAARGDVVYLTSNASRDLFAFGRVTIAADGTVSPFEPLATRDNADLSEFRVNDQGTMAVLNWNLAGRSEPVLFDLATKKERPFPKLAGDIMGGFVFSRDGSKVAFVVSGATTPADIWTMDVSGGTPKQITHSQHPGVDLTTLIRPELVTYTADDGLALSGWLYRPRNAKPPYATVLNFHGGPEGQERPSFNTTYQALLAGGIAVFAPNVRGSAGFGKRFVNLDNGALRVGAVRDIKSTTDYLVKQGISDPKRLGIMGGSYGGYMVMAGVTEYPDLFAAGADLFGVVNFETFFAHSEPWMAAISTIEYGDPKTQLDMLRSLSPIHKVDRVKTPLIVLHGANDTNVPVIEAEQVVSSLKQRKVPVEYILFPDEGHGFRKTPNRIRSALALTKFFQERLLAH